MRHRSFEDAEKMVGWTTCAAFREKPRSRLELMGSKAVILKLFHCKGLFTSLKFIKDLQKLLFMWVVVNNIYRCLSGKESACQCRRHGVNPRVRKDPLEKDMATHSSILAWEIPWREEPGRL